MKLIKNYYIYLFPILFVFPTVNIFAYIGLNIPQFTLSNISIVLFILISFVYDKIEKKSTLLIFLFLLLLTLSVFIGSVLLTPKAINRGFIYLLYYIYIVFIFYAIFKTNYHFYRSKEEVFFEVVLQKIAIVALIVFYLVTLYQLYYSSSPALLSSDLTLGYRDFRSPIVENVHNYDVFRALGSFPEPSMYAGFIVSLLPMLLVKNKFLTAILILLVVMSVLLTYSRIGVILLFLYILIVFFLSNRRFIFVFVSSIIIAVLLLMDTLFFAGQYFISNVLRMISMFEYMDVSILTRVMTPIILFQSLDYQILWGYGLGSLIDIFSTLDLASGNMEFKVPTLNNFYLNFIVEFGLIPFIIFFYFLVKFILKLTKKGVHKKHRSVFISFLLTLSYFFQIGHLTMFYMYFILILLFSILFFYLKRVDEAE